MHNKIHYVSPYLSAPPHPISITLVGCGGTGSMVLNNLARINFALLSMGHPGIFVYAMDGDRVDHTNIGRQMFSPADLEMNKAEVLVTRINNYFGFNWDSTPVHLTKSNLKDWMSNIIISCVDNIKTRHIINKVLSGLKKIDDAPIKPIYWMDFGNGHRTGQVVVGTIEEIPQPDSKFETAGKLNNVIEQFPDLVPELDKPDEPSCSIAQALGKQDLFINSTLAQLGCGLLWKLLTEPKINYRGMFLNIDKFNANPIQI